MSTAVALAPAAPDDEPEHVLDHVLCACGRLAALLLVPDDIDVTAAISCGCGSYSPPEGSRS